MEKNFGKNNNKWKPGQSGNPAGKPKGAKNLVTAKHIREQLLKFVHEQAFPDILQNFDTYSNKDKIFLITKLLPYITPVLSASKHDFGDGTETSKIKFQIVYDDISTTPTDNEDGIDDADFKSLPPAPDDDLDF